jgi:fucose permease
VKRSLHRDRRTYLLYGVMCVFGFSQSVLGSALPFLRDELGYSDVDVGWHFSLYAVGVVGAGLASRAFLGQRGTSATMTQGLLALVTSMLLATVAVALGASLLVAVAIGFCGVVVQIAAQAEIVNRHEQGDLALTEAFVFAGVGVLAGPVIIGRAGALASWRWAMLVPLVAAIPLAVAVARDPAPRRDRVAQARARGRLPASVMVCWVMVVLAIATEWGIGFWGAEYLERRYDLAAAEAVTCMGVFFGGTVVGRVVSSRVLGRFDTRSVLNAALAAGAISVVGLWGFRLLPVGLVMLAVAGMSLGNYFPLILSVAMAEAGDEVERISSGSAQAIGLALLLAPLTLAYLGDRIGLVDAVGLLALLPLVMLGLLHGAGSRSEAPSGQAVSP